MRLFNRAASEEIRDRKRHKIFPVPAWHVFASNFEGVRDEKDSRFEERACQAILVVRSSEIVRP